VIALQRKTIYTEIADIKADIKEIRKHIEIVNDELGKVWQNMAKLTENQKWLKTILAGIFFLLLGLIIQNIFAG